MSDTNTLNNAFEVRNKQTKVIIVLFKRIYILVIALSLATFFPTKGFCQAAEDTGTLDFDPTRPIFSHRVGYAGEVMHHGESMPMFIMGDIYIFGPLKFKSARQQKKYYKIAYNIKKVYPIALDIQRTINTIVAHTDSLSSKKEKDEYIKEMEKVLQKKYKPQLKKLTFSQGKLLIKLIDRQCDATSYQLIKTYMGGFKATMWNTFASLFGASLKKEYDPEVDDRLTERCILLIESGQM